MDAKIIVIDYTETQPVVSDASKDVAEAMRLPVSKIIVRNVHVAENHPVTRRACETMRHCGYAVVVES